MDSAHDLGGRQGFGPIVVEPYERHYHARWEAATRLLFRVVLPRHLPNGTDGALRHAIERMDTVRYLTSSYYERWVTAAATLAVECGIVTQAELEARAGGGFPLSGPVTAETITDPPPGRARFTVGDRVRVGGAIPGGTPDVPGTSVATSVSSPAATGRSASLMLRRTPLVEYTNPHTPCVSTPTSCGTADNRA